MILRTINDKLKRKNFKIMLVFSLLIYIILFLSIKNEFFYNASQYMSTYLDYYIKTYLSNVAGDLIFDNGVMLYIESDVQNIFSSLYIYVVTFNNKIFLVFSLIMTLYIFYYISNTFYSDIFNGGAVSQVFRIGETKYLKKVIISNSLYCGILLLVPKILYFLLLSIFFPIGSSYVHFLGNVSFVSDKFLYIGYNCSPLLLIGLDLCLSFLYGIIISLISLIVVSIIKNKSLSYIVFVFIISSLSIIPLFFLHVPIIFYNSIFNYFNSFNIMSLELNVYEPIVISSIVILVLFISTKYILRSRIRMYI